MDNVCETCDHRVDCLVAIPNQELCSALFNTLFDVVKEFLNQVGERELGIIDLQVSEFRVTPFEGHDPPEKTEIVKTSAVLNKSTTGWWLVGRLITLFEVRHMSRVILKEWR